jgi:hypothetical protein
VLIVSHLCHPRPSANDNASGVAANLESARVLAALAAGGALPEPRASIRFLWIPELTGTYAWMGAVPDRAAGLIAALNLDMVGEDQEACGSTFLLESPPCFAGSFAEELLAHVRFPAQDWIASYSGPGHYGLARMAEVPYGGGSDHAVFADPAIGVPCPMLIQWPDRYYHSSYDTPDRCDPRSLALAVRCAATYAGFLATLDGPRRAWLADLVRRGAERRLLAACDRPDASRQVARERLRALTAAASLARLGVGAAAIGQVEGAVERRVAAEAVPEAMPPPGPSDLRVPARRLAAPLHVQRFLIEGWTRLPPAERDRWQEDEGGSPDAALALDLAWMACDGRRSIDALARLVWLECGHHDPGGIGRLFERAARMGLAAWVTEPSPGPATVRAG